VSGERTRRLPIPVGLSPLQKLHGVLIRCSSTWTTCEQSGTAKAPWKIQPDECCCPRKSDLSKPAIYTFNDPERLGGNFEGHSPCGIFIALPTVTMGAPARLSFTMLRPPLHSSPACRHSLDFAHVAMVYGGHPTIVPGNRDRVPTYFGDTAAIIGIALPVNAAALLETLRFRDRHAAPPIACHRVHITTSSLSLSLFVLSRRPPAPLLRRRAPDRH